MSYAALDAGRDRSRAGWVTGAVLVVWFAAVVVANATGAFRVAPDRPPLPLLLALLGPAVLFAGGYRVSAAFRDSVHGLDLRLLTALQAWRVVGVTFVVLEVEGLLPRLFGEPAGYGDLLVGVLAVPVLLAQLNGTPGWQAKVLWLNLLGLLDFAAAVGTGLLTSPGPLGVLQGAVSTEPLQHYPLNLIPTFGVPFWMLVHLASLLQLRHLKRSETP
ncbi:MAG: hypothetical protein HY060_06185 [Proteobacteria bacterium]|nr:hypothetical protein [Pseudomonadota bacterium]